MPEMQTRDEVEAKCPNCGVLHGHPKKSPENTVLCECGETLKFVVPIFAPPMGGPAYWGWKTEDGRYSWDPS